ncbi:efflux RND transporter periplasmic adaptor subunit [Paenibacillus macerans]|uniref:efflux RND transporter periplasmic adaptor subunit n=1 Tax=Paenibacillus macerans TaxID=44252 RepID=UPI00203CD7EF|nr:efflux RND transporter periplasmic adaptor subunit [Paenibacillus macerans]MCM3703595.1 efflux RND transporter periplasmic adaptor subunit [Paenibacillus macerans]
MKGRYLWLTIAAVFTLSLTACSSGNDGETAAANADSAVVEVVQVKQEPLNTVYDLSGTLQSADSATVTFQASGEIKQTLVEVGDKVKEGDVLAVLDDAQARIGVDQAKSGVAQAKGQVSAAEAGLAQAEAQIKNAEANLSAVKKGASEEQLAQVQNQAKQAEDAYNKAKTDADRYQNLYAQGLISLNEYEQTQLQLKNAANTLDSAKEQLKELADGATAEQLKTAKATLEQAQSGKQSAIAAKMQAEAGYQNALASQEQAELALSKTKLTATVSGTILEKMAVAGQAAGAGNPAFVIGSTAELQVLLPVPDSKISAWKAGQKVDVALGNETRTGTVTRVYPQTNTGTGTISVEVSVPNPNKDWFPGQVVKAGLQVSDQKGILVPAEAVISKGQEPYVFRDVNGKAVKTTVELGDEIIENRFRVLSGLQENDVVVTAGAEGLFDGDSIATAEDAADD